MANPEHLKILKQGVEVWNRWRDEDPDVIPELDHADLRGIDLRSANLSKSHLTGVFLTGANLSWANLKDANLSKADIGFAYLMNANLNNANLDGAILFGSALIHSDLTGTILVGTIISGTVFVGVDLSGTIGLNSARYMGPSSVGIDTIYRSDGKIPEAFLRGCGVPDNFIKNMTSLVDNASAYPSCFISYSSKDQDFSERLHADLQNKGVRCWFAPEDMKIGDKIRDRIDHSIRIHDKLLLILSENSINSEWVEDEVEAAYEQERQRGKTVLFPIRLDPAVMDTDKAWASKLRRPRHIGDFTQWKNHDSYQKAFDRLMRDLKADEPSGSD